MKSWLLAIPHYLVVGFFVGGGVGGVSWAADHSGRQTMTWGGGLVGLLAVIAGVVLLFTGRYPTTIFDLVLGMNRWALRVAAYALLMTDAYPPFLLDQGGLEPPDDPETAGPPERSAAPVPPAAPEHPENPERPASPAAHRGWSAGRIVTVTIGSVVLVASLVGTAAGVGLVAVNVGLRHSDGFLVAPTRSFSTSSYALATRSVDLGSADALPGRLLGDVRIEATSGTPVFVGVASTRDADTYLSGVAHSVVSDMVDDGSGHLVPKYTQVTGDAPTSRPGQAGFWDASASGTHPTLTWHAHGGSWTAVVMNADGSAGVKADLKAAATLPLLRWGAAAVLISSGVGLLVGLALVIASVLTAGRARRREPN